MPLLKLATALLVLAAPADDHLLSGATLFRDGQFEDALVEFNVAGQLGAGADALWYEAATLSRLHRPSEALERFGAAAALEPRQDPLLDYYHAVACYEAHLLFCADRILGGIGERAGIRIGEQVHGLRDKLAPFLSAEPPTSSIDALLSLAADAKTKGRKHLAHELLTEASTLAQHRADQHGLHEAALQEGAAP